MELRYFHLKAILTENGTFTKLILPMILIANWIRRDPNQISPTVNIEPNHEFDHVVIQFTLQPKSLQELSSRTKVPLYIQSNLLQSDIQHHIDLTKLML